MDTADTMDANCEVDTKDAKHKRPVTDVFDPRIEWVVFGNRAYPQWRREYDVNFGFVLIVVVISVVAVLHILSERPRIHNGTQLDELRQASDERIASYRAFEEESARLAASQAATLAVFEESLRKLRVAQDEMLRDPDDEGYVTDDTDAQPDESRRDADERTTKDTAAAVDTWQNQLCGVTPQDPMCKRDGHTPFIGSRPFVW